LRIQTHGAAALGNSHGCGNKYRPRDPLRHQSKINNRQCHDQLPIDNAIRNPPIVNAIRNHQSAMQPTITNRQCNPQSPIGNAIRNHQSAMQPAITNRQCNPQSPIGNPQ
jgi:hypothetical protein